MFKIINSLNNSKFLSSIFIVIVSKLIYFIYVSKYNISSGKFIDFVFNSSLINIYISLYFFFSNSTLKFSI